VNFTLLVNSLAVGFGATVVAVVAGLGVALAWVTTGSKAGRDAWMGAALANAALPPFLVANAWLDLTAAWRAMTPPETMARLSLLWTAGVLATLLWPLAMLATLSAWSRISPQALEAEPRCRGGRLLWTVLIPAARSEWVAVALVILSLALANFTVPVLFQVRVFTEEFWIRFNTQLDVAGAFRAAWPLALVPLGLLWVLRRHPVSWPQPTGGGWTGSIRAASGGWGGVCRVGAGAWLALALALPLVRLVTTGRTWSELPGAWRAGFAAVENSLLGAVIPATAVVAVGVMAAVAGRRRPPASFLWLAFLIPGIVLAVGAIQVFNRDTVPGLYPGWGLVFGLLFVRYLAPGWTLLAESVRQSDPIPAEAAASLGAGRWRVFRDAVLPQVRPGLAAAWYAVYLLCLWDVETLVLIQPPGGETLALRIFNLLHYGHGSQVNALCVVMVGLALAPALLWRGGSWLLGLWGRGRGWVPAAVCVLACVGCGRNGEGPEPPVATLSSRWFSEARVIGSRGVAPGQFNKPRSLVCDRDDNLYVADLTGRIQKFSPDGEFLLQWQMPVTDLGKPKGMTLDRDGEVVVVEPHYMRVNHFTPQGVLTSQWGVKGTNAGQFILPRAVIQAANGDFYLSEYTVVDRVQRFAAAAKERGRIHAGPPSATPGSTSGPVPVPVADLLLRGWGTPGSAPGQFNRAEGLGLGPDGTVYVADSCNHRIQVFDPDGKFLREQGRAGSNPGEFSYPYDVRVDAAGNQYVCEFGNSRITILDARDRVLEVIGGPGRLPGQFANPWAIALDSRGNLYVADSQNHRVQKLVRRPGTTAARTPEVTAPPMATGQMGHGGRPSIP